jgi:hypothetical protein
VTPGPTQTVFPLGMTRSALSSVDVNVVSQLCALAGAPPSGVPVIDATAGAAPDDEPSSCAPPEDEAPATALPLLALAQPPTRHILRVSGARVRFAPRISAAASRPGA